jgi:hypothetical protein
MPALQKLIRFARTSPTEQYWLARRIVLQQLQAARATLNYRLAAHLAARGWQVGYHGCVRTAYIMGLFGTGRWYLNALILQNLGERANYFKDGIYCHPGPTAMIYSGHATIKYVSLFQELPAVTSQVLESVRSRFADLIFVYRHPLDSLLTNWIWVRTYLRDRRMISGISQVYESADQLCAELEGNFSEFEAFADGELFATMPGPRFLSFSEFVEETALFKESATLSLRLEDFAADPFNEFSKIIQVMSVELDLSGLDLARPKTQAYRYKVVADRVPRFRRFIDALDADTKRRIEQVGYEVGV